MFTHIDTTNKYEEKRVIVTGGAGAIGSRLSIALLELGAKVTVLDDLSSGYSWLLPQHENLTLVKGDITSQETLTGVFKEPADYVFHLAAFFANQNSLEHPETDLKVNGQGTLALLEALKGRSLTRLVYVGSSSAYSGIPPYSEKDVDINGFTTPYQATKLLGEIYCRIFGQKNDIPFSIARIFNSYGPGEVPGKYRNVIPNFFLDAMHGKPLSIRGDGNQTRDFTFVEDIVQGLLLLGIHKSAKSETFNLASGTETTIVELANQINRLTGNKAEFTYIPEQVWDKKRRLGDISKATSLLGYLPKQDLTTGLTETYEWFKENFNKIEQSAYF